MDGFTEGIAIQDSLTDETKGANFLIELSLIRFYLIPKVKQNDYDYFFVKPDRLDVLLTRSCMDLQNRNPTQPRIKQGAKLSA